MTAFETPGPITVVLSLVSARVRVSAAGGTRADVEVAPTDATSAADRRAADQTVVVRGEDGVTVRTPRHWGRQALGLGGRGTVDVTIRVPEGSRLHGGALEADLQAEGRLGECRFRTASGSLRLERTGTLELTTTDGDIAVDRVEGSARITGSGDLRVGTVDGSAVVRNLNGASRVGAVAGDVRCSSANGDITVDVAGSTVVARTANGEVRVGEAVRGRLVLASAAGDLEIGVRRGTAALLDLRSQSGRIRNALDPVAGPDRSDETVEVRARTASGDILVHRARGHR